MSAAAERFVQTCTHPQVKGSVRELLRILAQRIPEGQTTTPPITIEALATEARRHERTVRRGLDLLVALSCLRVHDGGRGNVARYELLTIDGARPAEAVPLPLRADLREAPRTKGVRKTSDIGPDLFTPTSDILPDVRAYTVGHFARRFLWMIVNVGHFARRWWQRSDILPDAGPSVYSATTTYVRSKKDPDPEVAQVAVVDARAREPADEFLAWFERTYPRFHHGAVCLINQAQDRRLTRELLKRPGTGVAHLQAMTVLMWSLTSDGVVGSNFWWIATQVTVRDVFVLHRKANFLDVEVRRRQQAPIAPSGLGWTCSHDPPCERNTDCIARTLAENRAERQERSG